MSLLLLAPLLLLPPPAPHVSVERCKHVKSRATTCVFQYRQARASIYICTKCVRYNRSHDGRGGKHRRNRWYATTGPPPNSAAAAQRLSRFGGRALRSGQPDADEVDEVVGGVVGGRLKVTWRGRPRCFGGGARTGGACATGRPLRGGLAGSVSAGIRAAFRRSVDTLSVLSPVSSRKKCVDHSSTR